MGCFESPIRPTQTTLFCPAIEGETLPKEEIMPGMSHVRASRLREVVCACGQRYSYLVTREASATYDGFTLTQSSADEKARENAKAKLEHLLESAVEACKCPRCGAITDEMRKKLEEDRANHGPDAVLKLLGAAGLILVAVWMWSFAQGSFDNNRHGRAVKLGLVALVSGGAGLLLGFGAIMSLGSGYRDKFVTAKVAGEAPAADPPAPGTA